MQVIKYLKEHGTAKLTEEFAISVKQYDDLLVLNYNQIESPKTHPLVVECRSLILDADLNIASRSFDRFFNYGEALNVVTDIDFTKAECFEKVDGSLIKIYHHKGRWNIATKGTAYGDSECMGHGITFQELVWKAVGVNNDVDFQAKIKDCIFDEDVTYIFEVTSFENRVVKRYEGYKLHFLAARVNKSGKYVSEKEARWFKDVVSRVDFIHYPESYKFDSVDECIHTARSLKNLDEGYVVYVDGVPVSKIKSPAYLAVHAIRGEGLTPKRIMQLVLVNEQDEYLTYFPEDEKFFQPYLNAMFAMTDAMRHAYETYKDIEDQKEFALQVRHYPFAPVLFKTRLNGKDLMSNFFTQTDKFQQTVLEKYL